ncbi:DMT family transporter [Oceanicella actignis]|uniref:Permease of the drug/metabolite transporter (DMT) superfamily n=1 Tax=Oceanicella actignis TaxID=1189325 RepID=A0A1M7TY40_9RHOB|nr:DMT family transporter [Oceanicella actignis]SET81072.1 Permease of the drug/metabolite transporter (DMT) superfamily [Oceanicella actignis]SHN75570.1 Permease of the drug/metabolite transporter (DMT) superfamily [Oceanicella actignis]
MSVAEGPPHPPAGAAAERDPGENARGAALMVAAMAGFAANDAIMKGVLESLPLFQAVFLRGLMGTALMALAAWRLGALRLPRGRDARLMAWRTAAEAGATAFYLTALMRMPLANATAILQAMPLTVTFAAALFLGAPVGWRRWSAIAAGFVGVLVILRPGPEGFGAGSLWVLAAVACMTARDLLSRSLSPALPSATATLWTMAALTLLAAPAAAAQGWAPVTPALALRLAAAACLILVGFGCVIAAMRVGDVAAVAPFRYVILVFAMILGAVFYGERPDAPMLLGAAIVIGAGLYTLRRERIRAED